jgi:hypothetical protein
MHHVSMRHIAIVAVAGLLMATLACGALPGQSGDTGEDVTAPEVIEEPVEEPTEALAEEVVEEPTEEPVEQAPEKTAPPASIEGAALAAGDYAVRGTNPDGSVYEGTLRITRQGRLYEFVWEAGNVFVGEGIQRGDKVAVAYPSDSCQVALYDIGSDGTLTGDWVDQEGAFGTEVATPTDGGGAVEGTYAYTGMAADGYTYGGTMTISASGDLYTVVQEQTDYSGDPFVSMGIRLGQAFALGYGPDVAEGTCGLALYTVQPDGSLDGVWGTFSVSDQMGTEIATPR